MAAIIAATSLMSGSMAHIIDRDAWAQNAEHWHGQWEGAASGAGVSVIFFSRTEVGEGPRLHSHPYAETFIVRSGRGLYTIGDKEIEAHAGQILVCPPDTPHKFRNLGPGRLETIDIHASETFITEWLE